jgi:sulfite exporter TauE/SafE
MDLALIAGAGLMGLAGAPHCTAMCAAPCAAVARRCGGSSGPAPGVGFQVGRLLGYAAGGAAVAAAVVAQGGRLQQLAEAALRLCCSSCRGGARGA